MGEFVCEKAEGTFYFLRSVEAETGVVTQLE